MLSSYLAMQSAMAMQNMAEIGMVQASNNMNMLAVNNSQPLRPSFAADLHNDLAIKANETRITVAKHLIDALEKKLGKDIKNSTPKYSGLDIKA